MKYETRSTKSETNTKLEARNQKRFDLEDRALLFARDVRSFVSKLPKTTAFIEDGKQVVRSSGSVGANYLEANESLSKKDFAMRIKIAKKEARETIWWLEVMVAPPEFIAAQQKLLNEATEIMKILGAILRSTA
ncbi:MAG: four helix bundle protein [Patescibacteria group bacterium]